MKTFEKLKQLSIADLHILLDVLSPINTSNRKILSLGKEEYNMVNIALSERIIKTFSNKDEKANERQVDVTDYKHLYNIEKEKNKKLEKEISIHKDANSK